MIDLSKYQMLKSKYRMDNDYEHQIRAPKGSKMIGTSGIEKGKEIACGGRWVKINQIINRNDPEIAKAIDETVENSKKDKILEISMNKIEGCKLKVPEPFMKDMYELMKNDFADVNSYESFLNKISNMSYLDFGKYKDSLVNKDRYKEFETIENAFNTLEMNKENLPKALMEVQDFLKNNYGKNLRTISSYDLKTIFKPSKLKNTDISENSKFLARILGSDAGKTMLVSIKSLQNWDNPTYNEIVHNFKIDRNIATRKVFKVDNAFLKQDYIDSLKSSLNFDKFNFDKFAEDTGFTVEKLKDIKNINAEIIHNGIPYIKFNDRFINLENGEISTYEEFVMSHKTNEIPDEVYCNVAGNSLRNLKISIALRALKSGKTFEKIESFSGKSDIQTCIDKNNIKDGGIWIGEDYLKINNGHYNDDSLNAILDYCKFIGKPITLVPYIENHELERRNNYQDISGISFFPEDYEGAHYFTKYDNSELEKALQFMIENADSIEPEEIDQIRDDFFQYTAGSTKYNLPLRGLILAMPQFKEGVFAISRMIDRMKNPSNRLKKPIVLCRYINDKTLEKMFGIKSDSILDDIKEGDILLEKGFSSCGIAEGIGLESLGKPIELQIECPVGTQGIFLDKISQYSSQEEIQDYYKQYAEYLKVKDKKAFGIFKRKPPKMPDSKNVSHECEFLLQACTYYQVISRKDNKLRIRIMRQCPPDILKIIVDEFKKEYGINLQTSDVNLTSP